ncbi:MAG: hypothetical protein ACLUD2_12995 [Clostridium sp.]
MRDEWFIRGEIPMTKSEVRAASVSRLELQTNSIVYDIGAGIGISFHSGGGTLRCRRAMCMPLNRGKRAVR